MKNIYKHIVYFLLINIVTPTISQNLQEIQRLKDEFQKSQNQQSDLQIQNQGEINIDPQTGLPTSSEVDVLASEPCKCRGCRSRCASCAFWWMWCLLCVLWPFL